MAGLSLMILGCFACKKPGKKIVARFKDSTVALAYDYPDMNDSMNYTYLEYYPDGKLHKKIPIKNGMIINFPTFFYPSGKVYEVDSLFHAKNKDSGYDCVTTRFYESGVKWAESIVRNGSKEGLTKVYSANGVLMKKYFLTKDSIKEGPYIEFYPNGKVSFEADFHLNEPNGMVYFFGEMGDTTKYYNSFHGQVFMPYKKWLDGGTVLVGEYRDSSGNSVSWKWYNKSGIKIKERVQQSNKKAFIAPE
jgi:hypothetical protein